MKAEAGVQIRFSALYYKSVAISFVTGFCFYWHNSMRIIFALIVAVISNSEIIAQTLSSGYIINLKRDTIHGFIADRTDKEMAINIKFTKEKDGSGLTKYAPAELLGMGFDNARVFERF